MALQENVGVRLAYKFNSSGDMVAGTEADTATIPGTGSAFELRRVASTLTLGKDTYQSEEIRTSRQIYDFRHGVRRVQGELSGEFSPATYWDFIEAATRGTDSATITKTQAEFTSVAADSGTSKFTVAASTWAAQGFRVGDVIRFSTLSEATNNTKNFLIYNLSTVDAFVSPAPTTMGADTTFTVDRPGRKVFIPASGHVKRLVTIEHFHQDVDVTQLFTENRVTGMRVQLPATGMSRISFPIMGRGQDILTAGASPYFVTPTAQTSTGVTAAVNGKLLYQNASVGVITGIDFTLAMATEAPAVVGQDFVPEIFLGRSIVTGSLTALFQDSTFLAAFDAETEVELILMLTTTSAANSPFITMTLPRVKLGSADLPLQGEAGLPISCNFQALELPTTTGSDATTLVITDSEAT